MSHDDYALYLLQKYRLAVIIAVLKTKPQNASLEAHIQELRNKLHRKEMDLDNLNISINSDDFKLNETNEFSNNFDKNNDLNDRNGDRLKMIDNNDKCNENTAQINDTQGLNINIDHISSQSQKYRSQVEINDDIDHRDDVDMFDTQDLNESITILQNLGSTDLLNIINTEEEENQRNSFTDVMDILKRIDNETISIDATISNAGLTKSDDKKMQVLIDQMDINTQCYTDVEMTQCESLDIMPIINKQKIISQEHNYCLTIDTQILDSEDGKKVDAMNKPTHYAMNSDEMKNQLKIDNVGYCDSIGNIKAKSNNVTKECSTENRNMSNNSQHKPLSSIRNYRHKKEFINIYHNVANIFDTKNIKDDTKQMSDKLVAKDEEQELRNIDKHKTLPNPSQDLTQDFTCNTHYSQSQINDINIQEKYIYGTKRNNSLNILKTEATICKKRKDDIIKDKIINKTKEEQFNKKTNITIDLENYEQNNKIINFSTTDKIINKILDTTEENSTSNVVQDQTMHYSQDYIFSKELPEVFLPSHLLGQNNENQIPFVDKPDQNILQDKSEQNGNKLSNVLQNKTDDEDNIFFANANRTHIENQLFSDDSRSTNFSSLSLDTYQNYISDDSMGLSQNKSHFRNKIYRKINYEKSEETNESCADFGNYFKNTFNDDLFGNNIVANSDNTQTDNVRFNKSENVKTLENNTIMEGRKSDDNFDKNAGNENVIKHNMTKIDDTDTEIQSNEMSILYDEGRPNDMPANEGYTNFDDDLQEKEEDAGLDTEVVPFKIIEELNKVKMYLNKRIEKSQKGYSSDTGYRSDSSTKTSLKASQTSISWVDQAAYNLFTYITECPLISTTQGITREISIILGQLIDKLNEEEKYPAFLEDMLDAIQNMLGHIYEDTSDENMLTIKDNYLHRIVLLNKSIHIQKYTIEKIAQKLEILHKELISNGTDFEMKHISQIENSCYIFHLLEMLLVKYNKTHNLSQNTPSLSQNAQSLSQNTQSLSQNTQSLTQNSQDEEKQLKKSGIMDIWRKKWNISYKEVENEGSQEKTCEISKCSAILNKLIVECMDGYSLIAYYALKCYNVMQN